LFPAEHRQGTSLVGGCSSNIPIRSGGGEDFWTNICSHVKEICYAIARLHGVGTPLCSTSSSWRLIHGLWRFHLEIWRLQAVCRGWLVVFPMCVYVFFTLFMGAPFWLFQLRWGFLRPL